jgi:hypothetical protein
MSIAECDVPHASVLDRGVIEAAYFRDAYRACLRGTNATVVDIFFAIFGHKPIWMKFTLIVRNRIASLCGLEAPTATEIINPQFKGPYAVGNKIGPWPIYFLSETELVAGRDNKHLDFRLSVLKESDSGNPRVTVSTICTTHNAFGRIYLFFIIPFHKWGMRQLMLRAVRSGRL